MQQLGLAGGGVAPARLHAPRLEVAAVGAGGDLAIGLLRRQPDFQVVGLAGREAHVAGAQQHLAVRQAKRLQHHFGAAGHAFVFGGAVLRAAHADQFHLLELVLADHAAGVAAAAAGLGAEAQRVRSHAQRQALGLDDLVAHQVGQRDFRGGDQIALLFAQRGGEHVFLELRQLAGAVQAVGVDDHRHVGFLVGMRAGVQVQHELRQGAVQARDRPTQHGEARARQLGRRLAVQPAVACAEFDMVLDLEIEAARGAPALQFDVVGLVLAGGHIGLRQVGNLQRQRLQLRADLVQTLLGGLQLVAEAGHFGHQRTRILALGLGLADRLGTAVAQALQFLGPHLDALAVGLQGLQGGHVQRIAATGAQALGEVGGLLAKQSGIEHGRGVPGERTRDYRLSVAVLPTRARRGARFTAAMPESNGSLR
ncbi:hypothetical protein NB689_003373 [Xanthomonas sacchari]|nr:hypothetical protein [Xanthomonas sacchari]